MSLSLPSYIKNIAHSVLKETGEDGILLKQTGTVNPINGMVDNTEAQHTIKMSFGKIGIKEEYGVDFDFDERRCYMSGTDMDTAGVTPDKDDKVIVGGQTWTITWVHQYRIAGDDVFWMCKVRA